MYTKVENLSNYSIKTIVKEKNNFITINYLMYYILCFYYVCIAEEGTYVTCTGFVRGVANKGWGNVLWLVGELGVLRSLSTEVGACWGVCLRVLGDCSRSCSVSLLPQRKVVKDYIGSGHQCI